MKPTRGFQTGLILSLLFVSVVAPILLFGLPTFSRSNGDKFVNDISSIKGSSSTLQLESMELAGGEKGNEHDNLFLEGRKDSWSNATKSFTVKGGEGGRTADELSKHNDDLPSIAAGVKDIKLKSRPKISRREDNARHNRGKESRGSSTAIIDVKIREIKDHLIMAKAYLYFTPNSNSHLPRELRLRIKEMERVLSHAAKDSDLSKSALQRKKAMVVSLSKAKALYPDCAAMVSKLRSMAFDTEDYLKAQKSQAAYLVQVAARTFPKGLHCLSMRLTGEYFALKLKVDVHYRQRLKRLDLYHFAIFSDNILACAVVVNSTISTSKEPEKIVFHVVTDSLNHRAMKMWFLSNPPGHSSIEIQNMNDFNWLPSGYSSAVKQLGANEPRFSSLLNHLRFYLPQMFPYLDKVLLLDHDIVVQTDLSGLWKINMNGMVNGAVEICNQGESFHRLETLVDFSDPAMARKFDPKACLWAFGMNMFDLQQWRRQGLTSVYHQWLKLLHVREKRLLKAGSWPLGQVTFYNHTMALGRQWHLGGLGYNSDVSIADIEKAAVIHYDGIMKPWLEIGIQDYREYWNRFLNFDHKYLRQCNIHP